MPTRKEYDKTIEDYTQALQVNPNYASAYTGRGVAYHNKKNYTRARADYEQALRLDPDDDTARHNLNILRQMGY
jgi:Flp pilus assembly protein TadD